MVWFGLCCLMTSGLSKDIRCHVWPYFYKQVQISRSDIRPHIKWAVSLVILHMVTSIFLQSLCGYIWVNILTLSPQRGTNSHGRGNIIKSNRKERGQRSFNWSWILALICLFSTNQVKTKTPSVCAQRHFKMSRNEAKDHSHYSTLLSMWCTCDLINSINTVKYDYMDDQMNWKV